MSTLVISNIKATGETASRAVSGVAAAWVNFDGTGTIAIRGSQGISGLVDDATGTYTINFSSNMGNDDYAVGTSGKASQSHARGGAHIGAYQSGNNFGTDTDGSYAVGSFKLGVTAASSSSENGSLQDIDAIDCIFHGDLA